MRAGAIPFAVGVWLFLAGVVSQVFLAGMALFGLSDWTNHGSLGWTLPLLSLFLPLLALISGVRRRTLGLVLLLMLATLIQPELALARHDNPVLAAFHPVNAMLVFGLAFLSARASLRELGRTDAPASEAPPATAPRHDSSTSPSTTL